MITVTQVARDKATALAERFEGLKLYAYRNDHDVPTIGRGHTRGVKLGDTCTLQQADQWLEEDMVIAVADVHEHVAHQLTDNQAAALIDFAFNCGATNLNSSTLLREINANDLSDAPTQLRRWVHDHAGNVLTGLVARREAEATLFVTPDKGTQQ